MAKARIGHLTGVAGLLAFLAIPAGAQQLDPQVGVPLMQMINNAGMQCQAGNPQGCALVPQLQQLGNELLQAQFACQQGNPQACQAFQMGAQQVIAAWQGGMAQGPAPSQQQQAWDHQMRMQQQQMMFQQQQDRVAQQQRMNDERHRIFMEQLRR